MTARSTGRLGLDTRQSAPKKIVSYKAVVFDLFGTLARNYPIEESRNELRAMASLLGVPVEEFLRRWRETRSDRWIGVLPSVEANLQHICSILGYQPPGSDIAAAAQVRCDGEQRFFVARPDAVDTLKALRTAGCKTGLISNCGPEVPAVWRSSPLAAHMDAALLSCEVGLEKPDARIYMLACRTLGVDPDDCFYVGDGESNELTGAALVGMHPVCIDVPGDITRAETREAWQGPRVSSLSGLLAFL